MIHINFLKNMFYNRFLCPQSAVIQGQIYNKKNEKMLSFR